MANVNDPRNIVTDSSTYTFLKIYDLSLIHQMVQAGEKLLTIFETYVEIPHESQETLPLKINLVYHSSGIK